MKTTAKKTATILATIHALSLLVFSYVYAAPGDLDPSFGKGGKVFTSIGKRDLYGAAVALQADGKIVTAGESKSLSSVDFALARFNPDGSLDATFGSGGKVTTDFGGTNESVTAIAIQTDGKIVAIGNMYVSGQHLFALARYNSDGSLDTTLDGDGKVTTAVRAFGYANAVALQADGKIVVAGWGQNGFNDVDFVLVRYNYNGALDTSFDGDGIVYTDFGRYDNDYAYAVAIQADGKIVAAGQALSGFALARYNNDGSLDTTFNGNGKVVPAPGAFISNAAYALAIQPDGKLVAAGGRARNFGIVEFAIMRFNLNGSLDTSFDNGQVFFGFDNPQSSVGTASAAAIQSDGKILVAGGSNTFALARLNGDGTLDTTFNGDGKVITAIDNNSGGIRGIALRADGRIIAVASNYQSNLVSYNSNGALDTTFNRNGKLTIPSGNSNDVARDVAIQADGKIVTAGSADDGFALTRHNVDGSLDTTFDGDGIVTTAMSGSANAIAIQSDGKIVVAGNNFYGTSGVALARFNSDGSPDTTFHGNGQATTAFAGYALAYAYDLAIQADGKIVVAGSAGTNPTPSNNSVFALSRFNRDGSLDTTFGRDGKVTTAFDGIGSAYAIAIQADGKLVAAGYAGSSQSNSVFALARYNNDGSLDTGFSGDGRVTTDFNRTANYARAVTIQADGKIVAAGYTGLTFSEFALARFNNDGSLDATFDGDGKVITSFDNNYDQAYALAIQSDGKIIAAGEGGQCYVDDDFRDNVYCSSTNIALARYNADGSLDTNFSGDGKVTDDFGTGGGYAYGIAFRSGGRIVVAGTVPNSDNDFFLAQYQGNSNADLFVTISGRVLTPDRRGLRNAEVSLVDALGLVRTARSSSAGNYSFDNVRSGETYQIAVSSKRYRYSPQQLLITNNLSNMDFVGTE